MTRVLAAIGVLGLSLILTTPGRGDELILPQNRDAFYADESIELAVAGLNRGQTATIRLTPQRTPGGAAACEINLDGDGSTVVDVLPPLFLAPESMTSRSTASRLRNG